MTEQRDFKLGDSVLVDGKFPAVTVTGFRRLSGRETYRVEDADGKTHEWIAAQRLSIVEEAPDAPEPEFAVGEKVTMCGATYEVISSRIVVGVLLYKIALGEHVFTDVPEHCLYRAQGKDSDVEDTASGDEWQPLDSANDALPWIGSQVDIRDEGGRLHTGKLLMVQAEETTTTLILSGEVSVRISDGLCIRDSRPFQDIDTHEQAIALIGKLCMFAVAGVEPCKAVTHEVTVYEDSFVVQAGPNAFHSEKGIRARVIGE